MKKRIIVIVVCIALLFTAIGVGVGASILASANNLTQDDIRFLRGYAGEKGDWSIEGNKINLNGSGVVSSAQSIVWDADTLSGESGIVFTVTYNEDYTNLGTADPSQYRFAVALMNSQNFQGNAEGQGLGIEYRLTNTDGNIQTRGLYYDGTQSLDIKWPERNTSTGNGNATQAKSILTKITYNGGKWTIWYDKSGDGTFGSGDQDIAFDPNGNWEKNNGSATYFPKDLISGEKAYLVFGSYNANKMNMSISINQVYGGFSLQTETYTDTVTRVGENIALEDNILTRFYVKYSSYDMIAKGGNVNLTCGDKSVNYELIDGTLLEGLTYGYTIPIPAALGTETITLTVRSDALDGEENPVWSGTWSTTVKAYLDALKADTTGEDENSVALRALCDSINDYCSKAKAYFDLVNDSN